MSITRGADVQWTNTYVSTGDFNRAANWKNGKMPGATDIIPWHSYSGPPSLHKYALDLTMSAPAAIQSWDQDYWATTIKLNLNGKTLTCSGMYGAEAFGGSIGITNLVFGGGKLNVGWLRIGGSKSVAVNPRFELSGTGTRLTTGDNDSYGDGVAYIANNSRVRIHSGAVLSNGASQCASILGSGASSSVNPMNANVVLTDPGTRWDNSGVLAVGYVKGDGTLTVTNGAVYCGAGNINLGGWQYVYTNVSDHLSKGTIRITGPGSLFSTGGRTDVGLLSTGEVAVVSGGCFQSEGRVILGKGYSDWQADHISTHGGTNTHAYGMLTVSGAGSTASVQRISTGFAGSSAIVVEDGGVIETHTLGIDLTNGTLMVKDALVRTQADFYSGGSNTFSFELGAKPHAEYYLVVGTQFTLGGMDLLDLSVANDFSANDGDTIKLIGYATRTGTFDNVPDGAAIGAGVYTFTLCYGDRDICLTVSVPHNTFSYTAAANGTISGTTPQKVNFGSNGTPVTALPDTGYRFIQWSDGSAANPRTDTGGSGDVAVTATFGIAPGYFGFIFLPGEGGALSGVLSQVILQGGSGTPVTAVPDPGWYFVQWELDGQAYLSDNPLTVTQVTREMSLLARFSRLPGIFRIERNPAGHFKISWNSTGGFRYRVQYSNGSAGGGYSASFTDIVRSAGEETDPGEPGEPGTMEFVDDLTRTGGAPPYLARYFRVMSVFTHWLTYTADANGTINGSTPQAVVQGDSGTPVTAVPDTGFRFVQWSDLSTANPRTDSNVAGNVAVRAMFAARTNQWTLQDFLATVKPLEHTQAQTAGFPPIMGWAFPETPNYQGEAVTQRSNGSLQTKWSQYWSRYCVPCINLRGLPDPQAPGLMQNAIAAALTFQDLGIPIHLFIDPWKWYMALASRQQFPEWGHAPYDFWPETGVVDGHPVWWTDTGGVRIHPVYPWSINADAYASMVYTLQTFKNGGISNASVGGTWSDYETLPGPFDGELEWQKGWYLAHPTAGAFVNPYDALIQAYAGGNTTLFWTGLNGPFAQYCWDLRWSQVTGGLLQPVRDVFGTGPIFGEYDDRWSSTTNPTYDENNFPYRVNIAPAGVGMPSCYALNAFLTPYLGGEGKPAFNQANADAVYWFLMLRTASGSVANAPVDGRHVFWVSSDCRDSDNPTNQYGMTRALYREFLRQLYLRGASGTMTFAHEGTGADIALPMYEDARWVLDEMLSYRAYLQDLPSTSTAHKVLNAAFAPVFDTGPVWSGMANTSITTGDRWLVRVVTMSGAATHLTITPEPSFAGTQFTLAAPPDGATYLLHTAGGSTRTDTRPAGAYLKLDRNYSDSSAHHLAATGWRAGANSVLPGFTTAIPGSSIIAATYGLYGNRTNIAAVSLSGPSSSRGSGNFVKVPNTSNVFNTVAFTVEGWVLVTKMEDDSSLFSKGLDASSPANWDWQIQCRANGTLQCLFASGDGSSSAWIETSTASLTLNTWHHVAMVCEDRKVSLYVDHVAQDWGSTSPAGISHSGTTATLAWSMARHTGDAIQLGLFHQNFTGYIDEFRFTPEALSPLQMEQVGPLP